MRLRSKPASCVVNHFVTPTVCSFASEPELFAKRHERGDFSFCFHVTVSLRIHLCLFRLNMQDHLCCATLISDYLSMLPCHFAVIDGPLALHSCFLGHHPWSSLLYLALVHSSFVHTMTCDMADSSPVFSLSPFYLLCREIEAVDGEIKQLENEKAGIDREVSMRSKQFALLFQAIHLLNQSTAEQYPNSPVAGPAAAASSAAAFSSSASSTTSTAASTQHHTHTPTGTERPAGWMLVSSADGAAMDTS